MPRPKRSGWSPITITITDEIAHELRVLAASRKTYPGTIVDEVLRAMALRSGTFNSKEWLNALSDLGSSGGAQIAHATVGVPSLPSPSAAPLTPEAAAEFLLAKAVDDPDCNLFDPLHHLQVNPRAGGKCISVKMFKRFVIGAISAADWDLASSETRQRLKCLCQVADSFYMELEKQFPLDAERGAIWTLASAEAFGQLLGERLVPIADRGEPSDVARVAGEVAGLVRHFVRRKPYMVEGFSKECPSVLAVDIKMEAIPRRERE